jgi:hypothetical protein
MIISKRFSIYTRDLTLRFSGIATTALAVSMRDADVGLLQALVRQRVSEACHVCLCLCCARFPATFHVTSHRRHSLLGIGYALHHKLKML